MKTMFRRWLLITMLFLSACASEPDVILKPQEVDVLVPVTAQATRPAKPVLPSALLPKNASLTESVRALLKDRAVLQGYAAQLEACYPTVTKP